MEKKYITTFCIASAALMLLIFFFVTWTNPYGITKTPWSIDFVSDRNMALKKFVLARNPNYTDLVVGSSTGEVFLTELFKNNYGISAYQGCIGGAKTPYKLALIKNAIQHNPNLKRVIYIVDFFEFSNTDLETKIYYQKDIMNEVDEDLAAKLRRSDFKSRAQDFYSEATLKSSFQTFKDYKKFKKGNFQSHFYPDGSTVTPIVDHMQNTDLEGKTTRLSIRHKYLYEHMKQLDPLALEYFSRILEVTKKHNIKITFILTPMQANYYGYIKTYLKDSDILYKQWVKYVKGLESEMVQVVDYSYLTYLSKGMSDTNEHWHDGIHFGVKSAEIILNEVYKSEKNKLN